MSPSPCCLFTLYHNPNQPHCSLYHEQHTSRLFDIRASPTRPDHRTPPSRTIIDRTASRTTSDRRPAARVRRPLGITLQLIETMPSPQRQGATLPVIKDIRPRPSTSITTLPIIETVRPSARQPRHFPRPSVVQATVEDARPSIHIVDARPSIEARGRAQSPPVLAVPASAMSPVKPRRLHASSASRPPPKIRISSSSAPPAAPNPPRRTSATAAALHTQHVRAASDTFRPTAPRARVTRYAHSDDVAVASSSSSGSQIRSPRRPHRTERLTARAENDERLDDLIREKRGKDVSRRRDVVPVRRSVSRERVPRRNEQVFPRQGRVSGSGDRHEEERVVISRHKRPSFLNF